MSTNGFVVSCVLLITLGACTSSDEFQERFAYRWGPNPAMPSTEVKSVITSQIEVLGYISQNAFKTEYGTPPPGYTPQQYWFGVAEWGFNVGRQDCEIYMDYMFRLNREKQRSDLIISGLNTAASAIVTATTKSQKPLSILAASFGLATAFNDAIFDSYLFSEAPGLISIKVKELQDAYQQKVEQNQIKKPTIVTTINQTIKKSNMSTAGAPTKSDATDNTTTIVEPIATPEQAFNVIQNYYHICLPQSIEGVLLQAVADTKAKSNSPGNSSTPQLKAIN